MTKINKKEAGIGPFLKKTLPKSTFFQTRFVLSDGSATHCSLPNSFDHLCTIDNPPRYVKYLVSPILMV